jgi:apolipoprotein N-acyltransferase
MISGMFFDVGPVGGTIGVFAAVALFFVFLAVAFIAFKLLKRTVGMAVRLMVVAVILAVAFFGSIALLYFGGGHSPHPRPSPTRSK